MKGITSGERKELEEKEERKKKKYRMKKLGEDGVNMNGRSNSEVEVDLKDCDAGATLEEVQVALKKHKKKNKDDEGEKHLMIHDGNHGHKRKDREMDLEEVELKDGLKKDAKKKRKKTGDGDEKWSKVQKGEENRKKKWRDVGVHFNVDAERTRNGERSKVTTLSMNVVDEATVGGDATDWNVIDTGSEKYASSGCGKDRVKNMKKSRKTKNKKNLNPGQLVLEVPIEELGSQRNFVAKYDGSTDHKEVKVSGDERKKKSKWKKASDDCESKNDSSEEKQLWSSENANAEGNGTAEIASNATAKGKKRSEAKGKDEKGDIQKQNDHSENASHIDYEMKRKFSHGAEADGNWVSSVMRKEKGIDEASNSKKKKSTKTGSDISAVMKKEKKVRFSNEIEVFPAGNETDNEENIEVPLVQGKRFTPEEDEKIRKAVLNFIETHQLGEEGLHMVLNSRKYQQTRKCWKEIGTCLPYRPYMAVYFRAHVIFERSEKRKWEPEEYEILRRFYAANGANWKQLAQELGKHRIHLKDCWRRIKSPNFKKGAWSQDEYQNLFDLVNLDLKLKVFEEKKTKHGMLRDNISWGAISDKLSTRYTGACCDKWYKQLTSSLVRQGLWNDSDDYRLMEALQKVDACCFEDVDWDNLVEHRSGEICRKRWTEMTRHIGGYREKPFIEQVEVLAKRYTPDMIEYRT